MNISRRLRTCAKHTGLDSVIELLQEAADEIDALQARAQVQGEPVTVAVDHFDNGPFEAYTNRIYPHVEINTKLYTASQLVQATQAQMTDERAAFEEWATNEGKWPKAVDRDHNGCYLLLQTSYAWTVWQARSILALRPERVPMTWPKARDVGRFGDMSPSAHMRVGLDGDNDVYVSVWDETGGGSIEFCTPGAGGGSSSRTRQALIDLMVAMEEDNAERPDKDWWARRMGGITAQAKKEGE